MEINMNNELMFSTGKDDWETPQDFFNKINEEFHFTLDVCANSTNHKVDKYYSEDEDGLSKNWSGEVCWCNPPYSRATKKKKGQADWIKKCYEEGKKPNTIVVMLIPARTDTIAFHEYIYNKSEIRFIKGRLKFGDAKGSAPFPSMLVIYRGD